MQPIVDIRVMLLYHFIMKKIGVNIQKEKE